jgi:hypothetical protein
MYGFVMDIAAGTEKVTAAAVASASAVLAVPPVDIATSTLSGDLTERGAAALLSLP